MMTGAVVLLSGAASLACGNGNSGPQTAQRDAVSEEASPEVRAACDVFTLDMARQVLGERVRPDESQPFSGSSDDIAGSTCTYVADDPTPASQFLTTITASLLLKTGLTDLGRRSNQNSIEQNRAMFQDFDEGVEDVGGLGEMAYYVGGRTNQLHVLLDDGRHEMIVSVMDPDGDNRGATERLARMLVAKL